MNNQNIIVYRFNVLYQILKELEGEIPFNIIEILDEKTLIYEIKNLNNENLYFSLSHYLILYFLFRSIFEDTLAFVSIDFLLFSLCFSLISQKYKEKNN